MGLAKLFLIAAGLAMDAFAVSLCKGLSTLRLKKRHYLAVGLWFGGFQAAMPAVGYLLGSTFSEYIEAYDHWIAFILLGLIGANMVKEALSKEEGCGCDGETAIDEKGAFGFRTMLLMAVATSIDALVIGVSFALLPDVNIYAAVTFIGVITFFLSGVGLKIGNVFGSKYKSKAELIGGIILILMGVETLAEHLLTDAGIIS